MGLGFSGLGFRREVGGFTSRVQLFRAVSLPHKACLKTLNPYPLTLNPNYPNPNYPKP